MSFMLRRQPKQNDQSRTSLSPLPQLQPTSTPRSPPPPPPAHPALMVKSDFRWKTRSSPVSCRHSCCGLMCNLMPRILYHGGEGQQKNKGQKNKTKGLVPFSIHSQRPDCRRAEAVLLHANDGANGERGAVKDCA